MAEFKRLTTGEVASKRFTPVRMREGYSMDEVDEFLEAVENTIESYDDTLYNLNQELTAVKNAPPPVAVDTGELSRVQSELVNAKVSLSESQQQLSALQETLQLMGTQLIEARAEAEKNAALAAAASADAASAVANAAEAAAATPAIHTGPMDIIGATTTITRMLESAAKSHDDLIAQGESEALRIRDTAQEEADQILQEAEALAKKKLVEAESSSNASFAGLEGRKRDLEDAVEKLRVIERSSREALVKQYSTSLEEINAIPLIVDAAPQAELATGKHTFAESPSFS